MVWQISGILKSIMTNGRQVGQISQTHLHSLKDVCLQNKRNPSSGFQDLLRKRSVDIQPDIRGDAITPRPRFVGRGIKRDRHDTEITNLIYQLKWYILYKYRINSNFIDAQPFHFYGLSISSFRGACFNTSNIASSKSATLDPWCTFKQASLKEKRFKMAQGCYIV